MPPGTDWLKGNITREQIRQRNMAYVNPTIMRPWNTPLPPAEEFAFRRWLKDNNVPFDPEAHESDYDMRGFWQALMRGDERARTAVNPNDRRMHYPDYWKTPLHESFSADSQWALPTAPRWNEQDQLIAPSGRITVDEKRNADSKRQSAGSSGAAAIPGIEPAVAARQHRRR